MPLQLLGQGSDIPFSRSFFNIELREVLKLSGKADSQKLKLFLTDGTTLDVCEIVDQHERYLVLRGYRGEEEACDLSLQVLPYHLIYRLEVTPADAGGKRIGFSLASIKD